MQSERRLSVGRTPQMRLRDVVSDLMMLMMMLDICVCMMMMMMFITIFAGD